MAGAFDVVEAGELKGTERNRIDSILAVGMEESICR